MSTMDKALMFKETLAHVKLVAAALMREMYPGRDELTQRQAWEEFKKKRVERWVEEGLVKPRRIGSAKNARRMYSRLELQTAIEVEKKILENMANV